MRVLVDAIREVTDIQPFDPEGIRPFLLDALLRDTVHDLLPVAATQGVRLLLASDSLLPVQAAHRRLSTLAFRLVDSALSLARKGSDLRIVLTPRPECACLMVSWIQGPLPDHSPFSRQELGLLITQAGMEQLGADWTTMREGMMQTCTVRLPLVPPSTARNVTDLEILK
jgi:hypothetical protein